MGFLKNLFFNTNNEWKRLEWNKVPGWVKREFGKNCPSPVSRPPHFEMKFRGKTFHYRVIYEEINCNKTKLECFRRKRKKLR